MTDDLIEYNDNETSFETQEQETSEDLYDLDGLYTEEEKKTKQTKSIQQEKWFIPGKYKTKEDAIRNIKKQESYIKELENKIKNMEAEMNKYKNMVKQAIGENITEEEKKVNEFDINEFYKNPSEYIDNFIKNKINETLKPIQNVAVNNNFELIKQKIKAMYPNFDIDKNASQLAEIVKRFDPQYRATHPIEVLSYAIEQLGGKKVSNTSRDNIYSESGEYMPLEGFKPTSIANKIKESILNASTSVDVFNQS
ncbi:MAG: hypothetical protein QW474_01635 [Candidatus Aenigmatarchaeota archaeon]